MSALSTLLAILTAASLALPGFAADVKFTLSPRETWVGSPSRLEIEVSDARGDVPNPVLPQVEGCTLQLQPGRRTQTSMQFINGSTSSSTSVAITVLVTPSRAGLIDIPPVTLTIDGTEHSSGPLSLIAGKSEAGDRLRVEVTSDETTAYLGQPIEATLEIWVSPFTSREHSVRLSEADMWGLLSTDRTEWGAFQGEIRQLAQQNRRPIGHEEVVGQSVYYIYRIPLEVTPAKTGVPDFGLVRVVMDYPTELSTQRGLFGNRQLVISASQPISVEATVGNFSINEPPLEGRPASWNGAVGSFSVTATAKPLKIATGDPITLTYDIRSLGSASMLKSLQPPDFSKAEGMTPEFRIPEDPIAGTIEGNVKSFTQTLRATSPDVKQVPPIEYSWFDPRTDRYETAASAAIALVVSPAEHISSGAILGEGGLSPKSRSSLTSVAGGLVASAPVSESLLRGQSDASGWVAGLALLMGPLTCATALILARRRSMHRADSGLARDRGGMKVARTLLSRGEVTSAVCEFISAKTGRAPGTLTRADAVDLAREHGADEGLILKLNQLLASRERSRYAPSEQSTSVDATGTALACLKELDRLSWSRVITPNEGVSP
ncbi:MAG: hypothetical protein EXS00_07285 [Phycisphaerales bacterium]|nr:hypothetical protein [Phycisphaerales bacterium]